MIPTPMLKLSETVRQSVFLMKNLNQESGFESYGKAFKQLQTAKSLLVVWQLFPENGKRVVHETQLLDYSLDEQLLKLTSVNDFIDPSLPLFVYAQDQQAIFKVNVVTLEGDSFTTDFPSEIKILDMPDFESLGSRLGIDLKGMWRSRSGYRTGVAPGSWEVKSMSQRSSRDQDFLNNEFDHLSLDEEDKLFADKRESPRVRPKVQKLVKVVKKGESDVNFFDLFDLSRGGMSFVTTIPENYPKGAEIYVVGFDTFDLDDPLVGTVMSHRQIDGSQFDVKVGVKFVEGQA